jgi:hypothetical protein
LVSFTSFLVEDFDEETLAYDKMSPTLKTHLTSLEKSTAKHPSAAALKIPHWAEDGVFCGWKTITFSQFLNDVENTARYWANELLQRGIKERDIVGIW